MPLIPRLRLNWARNRRPKSHTNGASKDRNVKWFLRDDYGSPPQESVNWSPEAAIGLETWSEAAKHKNVSCGVSFCPKTDKIEA